jgi:hypothetical protein
VLDCDAGRSVYINLLRENLALYKVSLIGYYLMSNHIQLIDENLIGTAVPAVSGSS